MKKYEHRPWRGGNGKGPGCPSPPEYSQRDLPSTARGTCSLPFTLGMEGRHILEAFNDADFKSVPEHLLRAIDKNRDLRAKLVSPATSNPGDFLDTPLSSGIILARTRTRLHRFRPEFHG
jgi:hypothetical protein